MRRALIGLFILSLAMSAGAANEPYVPAELQPWKQWVMHGEEYRTCPMLINRSADPSAFVCAWAEPLQLLVSARGGRFDLRVRTYAETWLALPGDAVNFPQEVTVDNRPAPVIERENQPALYLAAGTHQISGRFSWTRRPETLGLPASLALVQLNVDGRVIESPERQGDRLWLGERRQAITEQRESIDVQVYRRLADGIPMLLDTQLRLAVAGSAREVLIGPALPADFLPVSLTSPLPARFEPDGRLRLQLRPGNWVIVFQARATGLGKQFGMGNPGAPWAQSEVWSYQADPSLRVTNATGKAPVDPGQVNVPGAWQQLPAFSLVPGQALEIEERSRGMSNQESNRLAVNRSLWLDFAGQGLTARDRVSGQMRRDWRLDMRAPFVLASASSEGEGLLVTQGAQPGLTGVELRTPSVNLDATSRLELDGAIPVSGWTQQIAQLGVNLNLPPGYMLLATTGVDQSPDAWAASWRLLDYFLVLVIAVAVRRLFGNLAGVVALLALAVTYHEPGAPVWTWLNLVVALALASAVSAGRFAWLVRAYRSASYLLVLVVLLPFAANQVRLALFPQLETVPLVSMSNYGALDQGWAGPGQVTAPGAREEALMRTSDAVEQVTVTAARMVKSASQGYAPPMPPPTRYDANALVQSGPGLPAWRWRSVSLAWNGPVQPDQTFRLIMLRPWQTAMWRVLGVLLAAGLFYLLLRASFNLPGHLRGLRAGPATAAVLGMLVLLPLAGALHAETPSPQILEALKSRLTAPAECMPQCALAAAARADAGQRELVIELDIHALERTAIPLPGQDGAWQPDSFSVDGRPGSLLYRDAGGVLWLPLEAGLHSVRLSGVMPDADSFQVPFPLRPKEMLASAAGWEVAGVQEQRMVTGSLEFTRIKVAEPGKPVAVDALSADRFASFVRLTRTLELGLDWTIRNEIRRIAPERGAITMEIPLLPGESVTSERVLVRDGRVIVAIGADQPVFSWSSALQRTPTIALTAPVDQPWVEVWQVSAGYTWRAEFSGTPQIMPERVSDAFWVPEYHPRPGESLEVKVTRPETVPGDTLALDRVGYVQQVGERGSILVLDIDYRSTRGQQHALSLPDGSELEAVTIDGKEQSLRLEDGRLELPIVPGTHSAQVRFRLSEGARWLQRLPALDVSAPASNVSLGFDMPQDRWVLLTSGPTLGPAVLYWPELVVFVLLAWLLGKTRMTPLKTRDWLLLGLGFSTFSWGVLALVTGWLFLMGWRARSEKLSETESFNLIQIALAVISVAVLFVLLSSIPMALLGNPDMHVTGNDSNMYNLRWFSDRIEAGLPAASVFSTPLWVYKSLILLWSLWLSFALVRWLPWAWQSFRAGGLWVPRPRGRQNKAADAPAE